MKNTYRITMMVFGMMATIALQADTITWTGGVGGTGTSWNDADNWDVGIPTSSDEAVFTDAGISENKIISLDASQSVTNLTISTALAFTIGSVDDVANAYTLTLNSVDRQDVTGTEGIHEFAAPVNIVPDASGNSTWKVNGSNVLRMNEVLGSSTSATFVKMGAGTFNMNFTSPTFSGPWNIVEGAVTASGSGSAPNSMKGNVSIGGTTEPASLTQSEKNALYSGMNITVLTNGTFTANSIDNSRVSSIHSKTGGLATIGTYFYSYRAYLTGGRINGGKFFNGGYGQKIESYASDTPAVFDCGFKFSTYYDASILVEDGGAIIDLLITKSLENGGSSKKLTKSGAGVLRMTGSSSLAIGTFKISGGTVLADNASGSATGKSQVTVNTGTTLGGTGTVGGVTGYTAANVTVASSSSSSPAILAPGTIDETTGNHIVGTLTVGGIDQTNNVTFGNNSQLSIQINTNSECDSLVVYGVLDLSTVNDFLDLSVYEDVGSGNYIIASAANGISGTFDTVTGLPSGAEIVYDTNDITLAIPARGTCIIIR